MKFACSNCGETYPASRTPYRCERCGGIFDVLVWDAYDPGKIDSSQPGIWRYRHTFGMEESAPVVSLGEGNTALVWIRAMDRMIGLKCEHQNPSGSFKDRGSALLAGFLKGRGVSQAIEDSSGNAGASFAAYAARAGIKARIFIPDSAAGPKKQQIYAYGAEVVRIIGPRSNAGEAVRRAADKGEAYASHAYLPFNLPGYASVAYELVEQLGQAPGTVVVPVGQGGLALGMMRGFENLKISRVIEKLPCLVAVQALACAPIWSLSVYGMAGLNLVGEGNTLAEGIKVSRPVRGDAVLRAVEASQGVCVAVDEPAILAGRDELARCGFYVEPTSAVIWDGLRQVVGKVPEPIVAILTGSGLKYSPR